LDTGLNCLVAMAKFHQIAADQTQLQHQFGLVDEVFSDTQILQAAKAISLKAKAIQPKAGDIKNDLLPAIAKAADGNYFIIARISHDYKKNADNIDTSTLNSSTKREKERKRERKIRNGLFNS